MPSSSGRHQLGTLGAVCLCMEPSASKSAVARQHRCWAAPLHGTGGLYGCSYHRIRSWRLPPCNRAATVSRGCSYHSCPLIPVPRSLQVKMPGSKEFEPSTLLTRNTYSLDQASALKEMKERLRPWQVLWCRRLATLPASLFACPASLPGLRGVAQWRAADTALLSVHGLLC